MSTQNLSDFNSPSRRSQIVSNGSVFADLNLSMPIHPNRRDISPLRDLDAVKQAVKNLVLTNYGERPFRPRLGSNVTSYLFEPVSHITAMTIREDIKEVLAEYEPRITDVTVQVDDDIDRNAYRVTIGFRIINEPEVQEVDFKLEQLR